MIETGFVDYYELLQLSSSADIDTIERVFRHLAQKFHPDHTQSTDADNDRFRMILEAYQTLVDPETRAGYDVKYQEYWNRKWKLASEASDGTAFSDDRATRESLLSLLYVQRRRNMNSPGLRGVRSGPPPVPTARTGGIPCVVFEGQGLGGAYRLRAVGDQRPGCRSGRTGSAPAPK